MIEKFVFSFSKTKKKKKKLDSTMTKDARKRVNILPILGKKKMRKEYKPTADITTDKNKFRRQMGERWSRILEEGGSRDDVKF